MLRRGDVAVVAVGDGDSDGGDSGEGGSSKKKKGGGGSKRSASAGRKSKGTRAEPTSPKRRRLRLNSSDDDVDDDDDSAADTQRLRAVGNIRASPPSPLTNAKAKANAGATKAGAAKAKEVMQTVMPLRAVTGVRGDELIHLTNRVRVLGRKVDAIVPPTAAASLGEGAVVEAEAGVVAGAGTVARREKDGTDNIATAGSSKNGGRPRTRSRSTSRSKRGLLLLLTSPEMKNTILTVLLIVLAIFIDYIALSELVHTLGGLFIVGTSATASVTAVNTNGNIGTLQQQQPPSLLPRALLFTPHSRRPSKRALDHTVMLATSVASSLDRLLTGGGATGSGTTGGGGNESETRRQHHHPHIRPPRRTPTTHVQRQRMMMNMRLSGPSADKAAAAAPHYDDYLYSYDSYDEAELSTVTLREFISHDDGFHLAMAPSFFGFYAYFGALTALNEDVLPLPAMSMPSSMTSSYSEENEQEEGKDEEESNVKVVLPTRKNLSNNKGNGKSEKKPNVLLKSVAGASAGAMAAVFLSAGADPRDAADLCINLKLRDVADLGGVGAAMKGHLFESIMKDKLSTVGRTSRFDEAVIPVAVSGFDLLSMSGTLLRDGCMAKAARASATFPGLFQPVAWSDDTAGGSSSTTTGDNRLLPDQLLIDGGLGDLYGLNGLSVISPDQPKRVVNLVVGDFGLQRPPGPSSMPRGITATEVASISIINTPKCGPWAMQNGPRAVEAARRAVAAVLDAPMHVGKEPGHYELHIDAAAFV